MKAADQFESACLSFTKPLEDGRGCWQISLAHTQTHTHTHSQGERDNVDVAKLSPAALTAGNTEEGETEGTNGERRGGKKNKLKLEGPMKW